MSTNTGGAPAGAAPSSASSGSSGPALSGPMTLDAAAAAWAQHQAGDDDGAARDSRPRDERGRFRGADGDEEERDDELEAGDEFEATEEGYEDELGEDGEDVEATEEPEVQTVKVTIDGEEKDVPLADVIAGYQMGADYTRKTQALAQERRQFEQVANRTLAERQAYTHLLGQVAQYLVSQAPSEDVIEQLMAQDPVEGFRAEKTRRQILAKAQEFHQGFQTMVQASVQEATALRQQNLQAALQELPRLIPEWRDPAVYQREVSQVAQTVLSAGFTAEELHAIDDPRAMVLARKAWQWDQLQAAKGQKLQPSPRATKPAPTLRPGAASDQPQRQALRTQKLRERAQSTGNLDDVAALYRASTRR